MKPQGKQTRKPYPGLEGHQDCGVCKEVKPPNKRRERQRVKKEIEAEVKDIVKDTKDAD